MALTVRRRMPAGSLLPARPAAPAAVAPGPWSGSPLSRSPASLAPGPHALADNHPVFPSQAAGRREQSAGGEHAGQVGQIEGQLAAATPRADRLATEAEQAVEAYNGAQVRLQQAQAPPCRPSRQPTPRRPRWVRPGPSSGGSRLRPTAPAATSAGSPASSWRATPPT